MVKRAVLFLNGDLARIPEIKIKPGDFLIGVDGGVNLIKKMKLTPGLVIGDFDSSPRPEKGFIYKKSQELTDTEFALDYCLKQGFKEVILVGALGIRLDHLLATILLGVNYRFSIIEGRQRLDFVTSRRVLEGQPGKLVSLVPLTDCSEVTTKGLRWPLQVEYLKLGSSRGISNVMTGKKASIRLKKGCLLVVYNLR